MNDDICRAITFINYHIPPILEPDMRIPYITVGFFDGMRTERLQFCYKNEELKTLWQYRINRMDEGTGQCSYQNIFCFSKDEWNGCNDNFFWEKNTNQKYPLTFVTFLQLKEYRTEPCSVEEQCRIFNGAVRKSIGNEGICYVYSTIDKNDFIVCMKCRKYGMAVEAIKSLHKTGTQVVYSYSVFSVSQEVLAHIREEEYQYIYAEEIFSICLKGITNSYNSPPGIALDQKYHEFGNRLAAELYLDEIKKKDYKIYDILGDDDFRFIARNVSLGRLLQQYSPGGLLRYEENDFRFFLFSSSMVLNTKTPQFDRMGRDLRTQVPCAGLCKQLQRELKQISEIVTENSLHVSERVLTFCYAAWQLLQSLKPMETAPVKKYDFCSLYHPLSLMMKILEDKLVNACRPDASDKDRDFIDNEEIYTFIHKISITLHGILRTDIQFFQIRDFNAIVHYAPAKLRAFYSLWVLRLADYYKLFNEDGVTNQYSFLLSPGMYQETCVSEFFENYEEQKRLMLIKVPERHLYSIRWFPIILVHEVSHFVGYAVRKRMERHLACMRCCARVLFLEINAHRYYAGSGKWQAFIGQAIRDLHFFRDMESELQREEEHVRKKEKLYPHEFHKANSIGIIEKTFRKVNEKYTAKMICEDSERVNAYIRREGGIDGKSFSKKNWLLRDITDYSNTQFKELMALNQRFESGWLELLLKILMYLCKEAYADLLAIFTLNLSPKEYIFSFSRAELHIEDVRLSDQTALLLVVRAGLVMKTVVDILGSRPKCFSAEFCEKWPVDLFVNLPVDFAGDSIERKLAVDVYGYVSGIRDCNDLIKNYKTVYNYKENRFCNRQLDFLNDKVIWDNLTGYLSECAKSYINFLGTDPQIKDRHLKILVTYNKVARGSITSMIQEIEDFLAGYEAEELGKTAERTYDRD